MMLVLAYLIVISVPSRVNDICHALESMEYLASICCLKPYQLENRDPQVFVCVLVASLLIEGG